MKSVAVMAKCLSCYYLCQVVLLIMEFMLISWSSTSSLLLSPSQSNLIYGNCAIENKTVNRYNYFIGFHFHEQVNLNISHGKFWMEILSSNKTNNSCAKWKSKRIYNNCSSISNSNTVSCVIGETDKHVINGYISVCFIYQI